MHLQSDSSTGYYPKNTISSFRNQLSRPLKLDAGQYEVGLAECSYTFKNLTIDPDQHVLSIGKVSGIFNPDPHHGTRLFSDIPKSDIPRYGIQSSSPKVKYIPKNIWDYASSNSLHISKVEDDFRSRGTAPSRSAIAVNEVTCQLVARKDINNNADLASELGHLLERFGISLETETYTNGRFYWTFKHSTPSMTVVRYSEKVECIGFNGSSWGYEGGIATNSMTTIGEPNLKMYDELCKVTFFEYLLDLQGLEVLSHIPQAQRRETSAIAFWKWIKNKMSITENETKVVSSASNVVYAVEMEHKSLQKKCTSVKQIVDAINQHADGYNFSLTENNVSYTIFKNSFKYELLELNEYCAAILGLSEVKISTDNDGNRVFTGEFRPLFNYGKSRMFVYCDIVEDQYVGHQMEPLLRIATYKGEENKITTNEFPQIQYVPVRKDYIENIHLYIRSEIGDVLPFDSGSLSATLHFRVRRY